MNLDNNYQDIKNMIGLEPVMVTLLAQETFPGYLRPSAEGQAAGFDLALQPKDWPI